MPEFAELQNFLKKYFPDRISSLQESQLKIAFEAFIEWNSQINLISRKDVENLAERHFLHSLAIAKAIEFPAGARVLDVGTGGGFPGLPLAIIFPETEFHLVDSIAKKIKVVRDIVQQCEIQNVQPIVQRAEQLPHQYDYVVSRAVASFDKFMPWIKGKTRCKANKFPGKGVYYLRGGDPVEEKKEINRLGFKAEILPISSWMDEPFFASKYIVQIPLCK